MVSSGQTVQFNSLDTLSGLAPLLRVRLSFSTLAVSAPTGLRIIPLNQMLGLHSISSPMARACFICTAVRSHLEQAMWPCCLTAVRISCTVLPLRRVRLVHSGFGAT
jgi:hypothetical protein